MEKTAYDIGVEAALAEAGMEKEAFLGALAGVGRALWGGGKALFGLWNKAKNIPLGRLGASAVQAGEGAAAKGLFQGVREAGGWGQSVLKPAWGQTATGFRNAATQVGNAFQTKGVMGGLGAAARSPLAKDMMINAGLGGAVGAATADPGDRMGGAMRGAGWGAAGGAAFKGVHSFMGNAIKTAPLAGARAQTGLKGFSTRMLSSPTLLATGATMAMPTGSQPKPGVPMSNLPNMQGM